MSPIRQTSKRTRTTSRRSLPLALVIIAFTAAMPHGAQSSRSDAASVKISVNRTVPRVSPPPSTPVFSEQPTTTELRRARVFSEPLVPIGAPSAAENQALAAAVSRYARAGRSLEVAPFLEFLHHQPSGAWRASLLANLGSVHQTAGQFTTALEEWDEAWRLAERDESREGRAIAGMAAGSALEFLGRLGHARGLDDWLQRIEERPVSGPASAKAARAREARAIIRRHPERVRASGPVALEVLLGAKSTKRDQQLMAAALTDSRAAQAGTNLAALAELASDAGLDLQAARRDKHAAPVVPSVVHLGFDHYSALVEERDGRYRLLDPALGGSVWMTPDALDQETSGYALVPRGPLPPGWSALSDDEAATVVGYSCPPGLPSPDDNPCPVGGDQGQGGGSSGCSGGSCGGPTGLPVYGLDPLQASVILRDAPLGYVPSRGPEVTFRVRYSHREENEPQVFSFANLGPKWWANWLAYVEEKPGYCDGVCTKDESAVHVPEGGVERYLYGYGYGREIYVGYPSERHFRSAAVLVITSADPIRYERRLPDGAIEVYDVSDGAVEGQRRIFLSKLIDPHGEEVQFTWDAQLRLVAVTDAIGQVTTLQYDDPGDALRVTGVTDPLGRTASFTYTADGQLASITDVAGLTASFAVDSSDFVSAMTTPYGTTTFRAPSMPAEYDRAVEATDPLGASERFEFRYIDAPVPASLPPEQVPPAFQGRNSTLNEVVSLHWKKGTTFSDAGQATQMRWMIYSQDIFADPGWAIGVLHSKQEPGEARVWYDYASESGNGASAVPTAIGRQLPDGTTHQVWRTRNRQDRITRELDAAGRDTTYTYAANGIDLLEVRNVTGGRNDLLASYADYTAGHQPQTITDAAGQVTHMTYNAAGQVLTVTNGRQETTTYAYDANGFLQSVTGPVAGATTGYTYDAYGRVRTITTDGITTTHDYDALNRPTRVTYPDGTYEETTYDRLDVGTRRDRSGRVTRYTYNARRQLVAVRDPAGRVVQQQWGAASALDALIDANGNRTRWERDLAGRVLREIRADNLTATEYTYDGFGRLQTVTDPKQQVATYTYQVDGAVASVTYTNAEIPTPGVTWTYDPAYARVTTMVDGTGTTSYTYHPVGQLGAGQVATVDGPLSNDVISYSYDELGRVVTRAIDGVPLTLTYDNLARVEREVNALGTFDYTYDGVSGRLATVTYPNGQTSTYSYYPAWQDHRLQTIHHRYPTTATLSKFDYTYDAVGNILTWRQQADTTAVVWEYGYDNAGQLVRAVKKATDPQGTVLQRFGYGYDPAGNRLFEQIDDQVTSWTYDPLNRLVDQRAGGLLRVAGSVNEPATVRVQGQPASTDASGIFVGGVSVGSGTSSFTVTATDASGNTSTQSYEIDQTGGSKTFTFDASGNMTSDGTRTFEWDARNQLVGVNAGTHRSEYAYDGARRQVHVLEREQGLETDRSDQVWCGGILCEERHTEEVRRYLDLGVNTNAGNIIYTLDQLGSVRETLDQSGALRSRFAYAPFGQRSLLFGGTDSSAVGFTGHHSLAHDDLSITLYRVYDAKLGRWLSDDPIGLTGGVNLQVYVRNRPTRDIDVFGLQAVRTFNCSPEQAAQAQTAIKQVCANFNSSPVGNCRKTLQQYGLADNFAKKCREGSFTAVCTPKCAIDNCGGTCGGPGWSDRIYLQPPGFHGSPGGLCPSLTNTVAHEMAHMAGLGADGMPQTFESHRKNRAIGEEIGLACGGR